MKKGKIVVTLTANNLNDSVDGTEQNLQTGTQPLLQVLYLTALQRGQNRMELAQVLGVTPGYISQLRSGLRQSNRISMSFARRCASYLNISTMGVLVLADVIDVTDFSWPHRDDATSQRAFALKLLTESVFQSIDVGNALEEEMSALREIAESASEAGYDFNGLPKVFVHAQRAAQALSDCEETSTH